jgi:ABC-type sugar transport system ATPase subunit
MSTAPPAVTGETIIDVRGLTKSYKGVHAVRGIDL